MTISTLPAAPTVSDIPSDFNTKAFALVGALDTLVTEINAQIVANSITDASDIVAMTSKPTPVDADLIPLVDSAASNVLKKLTWANLKATAKAYFDTLYQPADADLTTWAGVTPGTGVATALAVNVGSAGAPVVLNGAGGTPSSITLTNATGTAASLTAGLASGLTGTPNISVGTVTASGAGNIKGAFTLGEYNVSQPVLLFPGPSANPSSRGWGMRVQDVAFGDFAVWQSATPSGDPFAGARQLYITSTGLNSTAIGQTTPAAGSFTTLSATGNINSSGGWLQSGSSNTLYSSAGTGFFLQGPDTGATPLTIRGSSGTTWATLNASALGIVGLLDLSAATSGQIKFPATQNASADANTLDDYDEYTAASAACTGAITTAAVWKLTKVGNLVTLQIPAVSGTASAAADITFGTVLPAKYRPPANTSSVSIVITDNNVTATNPGLAFVYAATGVIKVYKDLAISNFTAGQTSGVSNITHISWTI